MRFYGLLDRELAEVIEFYPSKDVAERELTEILGYKPWWVEKLEIVLVDFSGAGDRIPARGGTLWAELAADTAKRAGGNRVHLDAMDD